MKYINKNFLVTGGAGFIGSNLCRFFLDNGAHVTVLDNFSTGFKHNIQALISHTNFILIEGDITDYDTCLHACNNIDYVLHHAALGSVSRSIKFPLATNKVNVDGFLNMLQAAKNCNVKRFIYASSSSVYGDDITMPKIEANIGNLLSPYAASKRTNELYAEVFAKTYSMQIIGLRYFNVFGNFQNPMGEYAAVIPLFIQSLLNKKAPTIFGDGKNTRDFTYVENVVHANDCAIQAEVGSKALVCNIAYGSTISLNDLFASIASILNEISIQPIYDKPRKGDILNSYANIDLAKKLLDYNSKINVVDGLTKTVEFYKNIKINY